MAGCSVVAVGTFKFVVRAPFLTSAGALTGSYEMLGGNSRSSTSQQRARSFKFGAQVNTPVHWQPGMSIRDPSVVRALADLGVPTEPHQVHEVGPDPRRALRALVGRISLRDMGG